VKRKQMKAFFGHIPNEYASYQRRDRPESKDLARELYSCQALEHRLWGDACTDFERKVLKMDKTKHRQKLDTAKLGIPFPVHLKGDIEDCPRCHNQ
jgi:hypothetical protein